MGVLSVALTSCENYPEGVPSFYSSDYRIVGTWQVSHAYLNGEEVDSTGLQNIMFRLDKVMHATVDVASRVGQGTVVTIFIPKGGTKDESDHS